ncbi:MAG: cytochrome c3 family protein [Candidatus Acidiferrales bacterium]
MKPTQGGFSPSHAFSYWKAFVFPGVLLALFVLFSIPAQAAKPGQSAAASQDAPDTPVPPPAPVQPIPYSHKTHLAIGLTCAYCHTDPGRGVMMTFPPTSLCMSCHSSIATDKPDIQKLTEYDRTKTPVPWVRVYTVIQGVHWSHGRHLEAGLQCEMCHGNVAEMSTMAEVKSVTSMGGCRTCHEEHHAKTTCVTCHYAWAPDMVVVKQP